METICRMNESSNKLYISRGKISEGTEDSRNQEQTAGLILEGKRRKDILQCLLYIDVASNMWDTPRNIDNSVSATNAMKS